MKLLVHLSLKYITALLMSSIFYLQTVAQRDVPSAYNANFKINAIRTWDVNKPGADPSTLTAQPVQDVRQSTQYFDGLGRSIQTVVKEGSLVTETGQLKDMVSPVEYDQFGREQFTYLPFVSSATDGSFKLDPFQQQASFMSQQYSAQGDTWYYGQTQFEASPLNRTVKTMVPGNNWVGAGRGIESGYWVNTDADDVKIWSLAEAEGSFGNYSTSASYTAGQLYKMVTRDEQGKLVIEFKDKDGKVVLKKVQLTATGDSGAGSGHTGWLCTYYIYDDLDNLRCVIQPRGVELLQSNSWNTNSLNGAILNEQCFRYYYDHRKRMVAKKVPGAAEVYLVYDSRDRLIMTQDGNMRTANKWHITFYDALNRPVKTGLLNNSFNNFSFTQHIVSAQSSPSVPYPFNPNGIIPSQYEWLTETGYDNYDLLPSGTGLTTGLNTTFINTECIYTDYNSALNGYPQELRPVLIARGMVTWTKLKVITSSAIYPPLYSLFIYDEKGRLIQTKSTNIEGGINTTTQQYAWNGQLLRKTEQYVRPYSETNTVLTKITYDALWRVEKIEKKIVSSLVNSGEIPSAWTLISQNGYDALGQLKIKHLGKKRESSDPLAKIGYEYNIRGWLLSLNKPFITGSDITDRYFGMELGYDKNGSLGSFSPHYNGNISGTIWKSAGDNEKRKFDYSYDPGNRLLGAQFTQYTDGNFNITAGLDFSASNLRYDANGNILSMKRRAWRMGGSFDMDRLGYNYQPNSNKLQNVIDTANDYNSVMGDFKTRNEYLTTLGGTKTSAANDYAYDNNGNLTADYNRAISQITYNHLNLPDAVNLARNGEEQQIRYIYDASGVKLIKSVAEPNQEKYSRTIYMGPCVFEKDSTSANFTTFRFVSHEEGRIRFSPVSIVNVMGNDTAKIDYDYFIKDHLGNVRMVLTDERKQDIYPAATLENATHNGATAISIEQQFYNIDPNKVVNKSAVPGITDYLNHNGNPPYNNNYHSIIAANSDRLYRIKANTSGNDLKDTSRTGLGITLRVMAGDLVYIFGKSYHKAPTGGYTDNATSMLVANIIDAFLGASGLSGKGITSSQVTGQAGFPGTVAALLSNPTGQTPSIPKASINWILFDEQLKYVSSGFDMVGESDIVKPHNPGAVPITIPKNGYIYVFCSNESRYPVFFDNLQVIHNRGPILEETHYYPFGLTMAGISSKALNGTAENKIEKFNGAELNTDFGLNTYEFYYRTYDPQIGRWHGLDTKPTDMVSPYAAMANNPIRYADPLGDTLALFRPDGTYWKSQDDGKEEWSGMFYQKSEVTSTYEKDGVSYEVRSYSEGRAFEFNDPATDVLGIKNGAITRVEIMSDAQVESHLDKSGVKSPEAQASPISFANEQGRQGNMDYGVKGLKSKDPNTRLNANTFYIRENHAYNVGDIGNYLWGRGMATLGISLGTASIGAHVNNMVNGRRDHTPLYSFGPGTNGKPGLFDSQADQRAIHRGHVNSPKGAMLMKQELQNWPKYNPK